MIDDMKRLMIAALLSGASGPCKEILQLCKGSDIVSSISECGFLSIEMWPSGINLDRMATVVRRICLIIRWLLREGVAMWHHHKPNGHVWGCRLLYDPVHKDASVSGGNVGYAQVIAQAPETEIP